MQKPKILKAKLVASTTMNLDNLCLSNYKENTKPVTTKFQDRLQRQSKIFKEVLSIRWYSHQKDVFFIVVTTMTGSLFHLIPSVLFLLYLEALKKLSLCVHL